MNALFSEIDDLVANVKKFAPDVWKLAAPRRFVPPHGYANPKIYSGFIAGQILAARKGEAMPNNSSPSLMILIDRLLKYRLPVYFISEEFARAVAATEPPKDMALSAINWPLPAMTLALPLAFSKEYSGAVSPFISAVKAEVGDYHIPGAPTLTNISEISRIIIHSQVFYGPMPIDYINVTRTDKLVTELARAEFVEWEEETKTRYSETFLEKAHAPSKESEIETANRLNSFATKLIMALSARPEMREEGAVQRAAKVKHGREVEELWSPNLIGRSYRIVYAPGHVPGVGHASPKMHWRRGHMRNQKHGHAHSLSKLIWIDPVLVNSEIERKETK